MGGAILCQRWLGCPPWCWGLVLPKCPTRKSSSACCSNTLRILHRKYLAKLSCCNELGKASTLHSTSILRVKCTRLGLRMTGTTLMRIFPSASCTCPKPQCKRTDRLFARKPCTTDCCLGGRWTAPSRFRGRGRRMIHKWGKVGRCRPDYSGRCWTSNNYTDCQRFWLSGMS